MLLEGGQGLRQSINDQRRCPGRCHRIKQQWDTQDMVQVAVGQHDLINGLQLRQLQGAQPRTGVDKGIVI